MRYQTWSRFLAGYADPAGDIYLIGRYYDPATGQFLSVDRIVRETHAPFEYASDNPVDLTDPTGNASRNDKIWMSASEANGIGLKLQESGSISDLLARFPELDDWVSLFASAFGQVAASVGPGLCYCASIVRSARRITYTTKPCGVWVTVWTWSAIPYQAAISTAIRRSPVGGGIPLTVFWAVQWEFWKLF